MDRIRIITLVFCILTLPVSVFSQCACAAGSSSNGSACSAESKGCFDSGSSSSGQCCSPGEGSTECSSTCGCSCRATTTVILSKDLIDNYNSGVATVHLDVTRETTPLRDEILNDPVGSPISHNQRQAILSVWRN